MASEAYYHFLEVLDDYMQSDQLPQVSILLAIRNEEEHLDRCLASIVSQDYPRDSIEIILVDGMSIDMTLEIIESWKRKDSRIRSLQNPRMIVSTGMNIGIAEASHDLILWTSGHVILQPDHIRRCVDTMEKTNASAVGGVLQAAALTSTGKINAAVLSSRFGIGNAPHRVATRSGWVPAVTMALYRKQAIIRVGGFDESLPRSQDNDLHDRMNRIGERSYLDVNIKPTYLCRETFGGFLKQAWTNGLWNIIITKTGGRGFNLRHFVPMIFVGVIALLLVLLAFTDLALYPLLGILAVYACVTLASSIVVALSRSMTWQILVIPMWFLSLHLTYGAGSWAGLIRPSDSAPEKQR